MTEEAVGMESAEPAEVQMSELAINNEVGIPDVSDADTSFASLRHKAREIGVEDFDNPKLDPSVPRPKMEPKPLKEVEDQGEAIELEVEKLGSEGEEKEIKNPQAWARVLQRQRDAKSKQVDVLESRLANMQSTLERLSAAGVKPADASAKTEDEQIDPESDPAGALMQAIKAVREDVQNIKLERQQTQTKEIIVEALNTVNTRLITEFQSEPVFQQATEHVGRIIERQVGRRYPNSTEGQRLAFVADQVNMKKLEWARDGLDPVEAMYEIAMDLGFDPEAASASLQSGGEPTGKSTSKSTSKSEDPRETIARAKKKASSVASTATVTGSVPKRGYTGRELLETKDENEFIHKLDELIKDGELTPGHSWGKTPSFAQMLPGKGRRI